jgi:V/A-type H+-transporting ATPase subunit D
MNGSMAKIKHTKNELKAQREALARFERFLPMLQLKKQQLQAEIQRIDAVIEEKNLAEQAVYAKVEPWTDLFSEAVNLDAFIALQDVVAEEGNIAGVPIPIFKEIVVSRHTPDLFATPTWIDDGSDVLEQLMGLQAEREILSEQRRLISEELRTTSQRVNLFEKVKIPECKENIRVIKVFLGDEQTAAVARGKMAKKRTAARV